eukprot:CAMPEP_0184693484 /NCGR_PEP_ID=MMETSP0313-20130426/1687_1 /TAXON_ID=2792 /ORGANISM="Porphyridium aerugineum, Strain SAG 1380-2" /LENGTH=247 /DNA_ID=CAMNT_0027151567 /DNA_START=453 /DNA_END=1196 /DNA_ORIENTATION=+
MDTGHVEKIISDEEARKRLETKSGRIRFLEEPADADAKGLGKSIRKLARSLSRNTSLKVPKQRDSVPTSTTGSDQASHFDGSYSGAAKAKSDDLDVIFIEEAEHVVEYYEPVDKEEHGNKQRTNEKVSHGANEQASESEDAQSALRRQETNDSFAGSDDGHDGTRLMKSNPDVINPSRSGIFKPFSPRDMHTGKGGTSFKTKESSFHSKDGATGSAAGILSPRSEIQASILDDDDAPDESKFEDADF